MANLYEEAAKLSAHDAEVFCGKNNIEFHPIACDLVTKRDNPDDPAARCTHVSKAVRDAADAQIKASTSSEAKAAEAASPGG